MSASSAAVQPQTQSPGRSMVWVPCDHCGCTVTHGVHNVSRLVRCVECGLVFVNPRPELDQVVALYDESYFHCDTPTAGGYEDYEGDRDEVLSTFRRRIERLRQLLPAGTPRVLDVGCATGIFLETAREAGWTVEGADISPYAVARCRDKGFTVRHGPLEDLGVPAAAYDLVTLWDIIEHVPSPSRFLRECFRILSPGGFLALSTPDAGSVPARILRGNWLGFRSLDEHLYFFSRGSLKSMAERAGFEVVAAESVGKYLSLPRLITRLRYYTRIGAWLLRNVDRMVPDLSFYINPGDTMAVYLRRPGS